MLEHMHKDILGGRHTMCGNKMLGRDLRSYSRSMNYHITCFKRIIKFYLGYTPYVYLGGIEMLNFLKEILLPNSSSPFHLNPTSHF